MMPLCIQDRYRLEKYNSASILYTIRKGEFIAIRLYLWERVEIWSAGYGIFSSLLLISQDYLLRSSPAAFSH